MAFSFYDSNMAFFKEHSPFLYNIIMQESSRFPNIQVSRAVGKDLNYIVSDNDKRCLLNSLDHKNAQMQKLIQQIDESAEMLVVFGFECGFFIEDVFTMRQKLQHIVVIEPCLQLFKDVLHSRDITPIFKKNKSISIILNRDIDETNEMLSSLLRIERHKKKAFIGHITYRTLLPQMYEKLIEGARDNIFSESVNLLTAYHTLHLYSYNFLKNQKHDFIFAEALFQELRNLKCPAIIVSAGPSLEKDIHLLREFHDKAFIVAVGTAIRILDVNGIKPHLRVAIDGFPSECIFEGIDTSTVPLLFSEKIHADVLGNYPGMKYKMILDVDWITKFFYYNTGYKQTLVRSGYSVANLSLDLLARLGFEKIILIGQDLCYKKQRMYAEGAMNNDEVDYSNTRFVKAKNVVGEEVYTTIQFLSMKNLFERIIQQHPGTEIVNATEEGLQIQGTINLPLQKAMENVKPEFLLKGIHERTQKKKIDRDHMFPIIKKNYDKFKKEVNFVLDLNTKRLEYLKSIADYENINDRLISPQKLQRFQEALQQYNKKFDEIDLYRYVFHPCLENIISSLREFYEYGGDEIDYKIQSLYKAVLAETTEVQRFAYLLKELSIELE